MLGQTFSCLTVIAFIEVHWSIDYSYVVLDNLAILDCDIDSSHQFNNPS